MPDDRHFNRPGPRGPDRGGFVPRRPGFVPRPGPPGGPSTEPVHSVRLREGDREVEVTGSAAFVRQALDDLPALLARLRGDSPPRPPSISLPRPPEAEPPVAPAPRDRAEGDGAASVEDQVLAVLRQARRPMGIADIRRRLGEHVTGQQVRRILERAGDQVVSTGDKPAAYRLR